MTFLRGLGGVIGWVVLASGCGSAESTASSVQDLTAAQCSYFAEGAKVTICHKTSATKKPYQSLSVSLTSCSSHVDHYGDYVAYNDPTCNGQGCFPEGAPFDGTVDCCEGLEPVDGVCKAIPVVVDTHHCAAGDVDLFVSDFDHHRVVRFDGTSGALLGDIVPASAGLSYPRGVAVDAANTLYVSNEGTGSVREFSACTGSFLGNVPGAESVGPLGLRLIDGSLYAGDNWYNRIVVKSGNQLVRFAGPLGPGPYDTFEGVSIGDRSNSVALAGPYAYVAGGFGNAVYRQDRVTGLYVDTIASVSGPSDLTIGPDGNLYVASFYGNSIVRVGLDGTPLGTFATVVSPQWLQFFGDSLYVSDGTAIHRFDAVTGADRGVIVDGAAYGISSLYYFAFIAH